MRNHPPLFQHPNKLILTEYELLSFSLRSFPQPPIVSGPNILKHAQIKFFRYNGMPIFVQVLYNKVKKLLAIQCVVI
jgi:hypothetical protein